ncbi:MAG: hypothetical protein IIZ12_03015 [Eggerthellaceae bacterium]|nr:hypothetical protein [Eggerthellaceae bacterium]
MTHYECDVCGKTLHHGDMFTATVKRVGAVSGRKYELCEECANKAKSVLAAFVATKEVTR